MKKAWAQMQARKRFNQRFSELRSHTRTILWDNGITTHKKLAAALSKPVKFLSLRQAGVGTLDECLKFLGRHPICAKPKAVAGKPGPSAMALRSAKQLHREYKN